MLSCFVLCGQIRGDEKCRVERDEKETYLPGKKKYQDGYIEGNNMNISMILLASFSLSLLMSLETS